MAKRATNAKNNHFSSVCRSYNTSTKGKCIHMLDEEPSRSKEDIHIDSNYCYSLEGTKEGKAKKQVKILNKQFQMQLDSGSNITIVLRNFWEAMDKPKLKPFHGKLKHYDNSTMHMLGHFTSMVETEHKYIVADIVVADCIKAHGLIGNDLLDINPCIREVNNITSSEIGRLNNYQAKITLKENATPCYFEARSIPVHMKDKIVDQINNNIDKDLMEKVPPGGSKWASPIVCVMKPTGKVRICGDYKVGVNHQICSDSYPIPHAETVLTKLNGMKHFAKIDLAQAYHQTSLDEESRELTTVNTPIGLVRWKVLPEGIKTASAIFQKAIETTIGVDITNCVAYQDDICCGAKTKEELQTKLAQILDRLSKAGMTVNKEKCIMEMRDIKFLGYCISENGIKPNQELIQKILNIEVPKNRKQLDSFMGLVNYYRRFVDHYADKVEPLNALRNKSTIFNWGTRQQEAFTELKRILSVPPVIAIFDPKRRSILTTDASQNAVAGILTQDGHLVLYMSRRLTTAEWSYSNIEREALAIMWSMFRACHFLLGAPFTLRTDHKPLEFILHPKRELPKVTLARILHWAIQLQAFDYEIEYIDGKAIPDVDALSRLEFTSEEKSTYETTQNSFVHWNNSDIANWHEIKQLTSADRVMASIMDRIKYNNWSRCSEAERPYKAMRTMLTIEDRVICKGDLVAPPPTLRKKFIQAVHDDIHCSASSTRHRVKLEAWWPGHCDDIERYVKNCATCAKIKPPAATKVHVWPQEQEAWSRVHIDHGYIDRYGLLLILVDAYSGWPEVVRVANHSAKTVQYVLRVIFA